MFELRILKPIFVCLLALLSFMAHQTFRITSKIYGPCRAASNSVSKMTSSRKMTSKFYVIFSHRWFQCNCKYLLFFFQNGIYAENNIRILHTYRYECEFFLLQLTYAAHVLSPKDRIATDRECNGPKCIYIVTLGTKRRVEVLHKKVQTVEK